MILKFVKGNRKCETVVLDNVSYLEYFSELHSAPIIEANLEEDLKEHIDIARDLIIKGTKQHIWLGLEITPERRKSKKVFFRKLTYIDRITKERVFVAHDGYVCFICNDSGKTIDRI